MPNITHISARARELIEQTTMPVDHPAPNVPFKLAPGDAPLELQKRPSSDHETDRQFQVRTQTNQQQGQALAGRTLRMLQDLVVVVRYAAGEKENRAVRLGDWAGADSALIHAVLRQKPVKDKWGAASDIIRDMRLVGTTELQESIAVEDTFHFMMRFAPLYDLEI